MKFLYQLGVLCYGWLIWLIAFHHQKARLFVDGRRGLFTNLEKQFKGKDVPVIWIHAASLGEFEQGRTIIEALKRTQSPYEILLTFFSPSGYESCKNYEKADFISYLPLDTPQNARQFVELVRPKMAIFIRYEFWYFYLKTLKQHQIPVIVVSAVFRKNQWFFHPTGRFMKRELLQIDRFFVQDLASKKLLKKAGIDQVELAGDSRFDRVQQIASEPREIDLIAEFKGGLPLMVLGSIWASDLKKLKPFLLSRKNLKFILAPHELDERFLKKLDALPHSGRFSLHDKNDLKSKRILILDTIGMLSSVYRYADYAYVGGGFHGALHNLLEPAVFGIPVFFGEHTHNRKFVEAKELVDCGGGFSFFDREEFIAKFEDLRKYEDSYLMAATASRKFVLKRTGATQKVVTRILEII